MPCTHGALTSDVLTLQKVIRNTGMSGQREDRESRSLLVIYVNFLSVASRRGARHVRSPRD